MKMPTARQQNQPHAQEPEFPHRTSRRVEKEISIAASPDEVWKAWSPEAISGWFTDSAEGEMRAGETIYWSFSEFGYRIPYRVLVAEPNRRLVLEWVGEGRPPGVLEVLFEHGDGVTNLRLINSGFLDGSQWDEEFAGIDSGWQMVLATLRYWLEKNRGLAKKSHLICRPTSAPAGAHRPYFVEGEKLAGWLGKISPARIDSGPFVLLLAGRKLGGNIETVTATEVLLSLQETRSLLALKAFSTPAGNNLALHFVTWTPAGEAFFEEVREYLEAALGRLAAKIEEPGRA